MTEEEISLQTQLAELRLELESERQKNKELAEQQDETAKRIARIKEYAKIFMDNSRPNVDPVQETMHHFAMSFLSGELDKI